MANAKKDSSSQEPNSVTQVTIHENPDEEKKEVSSKEAPKEVTKYDGGAILK